MSMSVVLTLDTLEQAILARDISGELIHRRDHRSQYLSIRHYARFVLEKALPLSKGDTLHLIRVPPEDTSFI